MAGKTISEQILSAKSGRDVRAGDFVICDVDLVVGTDASSPMAIDYFEQMGGSALFDPARVVFSLDHYAPPSSARTAGFHERVRTFARARGATVFGVGEGISHQVVAERGLALPGMLVVGADSHTVTCGALGAFATGIGSSDLAAAMITGQVWLRVPETVRVVLEGRLPRGVAAKDVALTLVGMFGPDGASYQTVEFHGSALGTLTQDDRFVLASLMVEADAKAGIVPVDEVTRRYLDGRSPSAGTPVASDADAVYAREITLDLATLGPQVALPHAPENVVPVGTTLDTPVHMVFIGTCTGGRVSDVHDVLAVLEAAGGRIAPSVQLVVTPASREVYLRLMADGTLARLTAMGATITTPGCGACCGTSGAIPADGMNVLSTANRNFKARMGNATASIYLASPAACAAAAVSGVITDPRALAP